MEFLEISYVITQLGRSDDGTDPWTPSHIEAPVGLKPYDQWSKGEIPGPCSSMKLGARLKKLPGMDVGISQPMIDNINDAVGGAHSALVMRIYGQDLAEMRKICDRICDVLHTVRGTAEASVFQEPLMPQIAIDVDRDVPRPGTASTSPTSPPSSSPAWAAPRSRRSTTPTASTTPS